MSFHDRRNTPDVDLAAALPELLDRAGVDRVNLEMVRRQPSFRGGDVSAQAQQITRAARLEHRERGFGFWEHVLWQASSAAPADRRALIRGALRHSTPGDSIRQELTIEELAAGLRSGRWLGLPARTMANLCSTVRRRNGTVAQLPMLDLGLSAHTENGSESVLDALDELGVSGALLASGRSFHFVGDTLMDGRELRRMLARAQLLSPLVDYRWVAHQLIDGECRLRISTDVERNTQPHRFIGSLPRS